MAILTSSNTSGYNDPRYWGNQTNYEQERRYREYMEIERQRMYMTAQQQAYNPYTDTYGGVTAQQIQEGKAEKPTAIKAATPEYLKNEKLLLLEK